MSWQWEQSWGGGILIADYLITDHWSVMYMKVLPDGPKSCGNVSNLEEVQNFDVRLYDHWSLISQVPEDLTWWSWVFWQCQQSWEGGILIADYVITDHWSVMHTWRPYLMILSVLTMRWILRKWNFDCRLFDHWSLISHVSLKILPDDPKCFDNASNLEKAKVLGCSAHVSCRIFSFNTTQ